MLDKKIKNIFLIAMIFISIISFFVVLCCNSTIESRYLCLLPLFLIFGLSVYLLANKNSVMYIGSFIIIVSYFIRMSVAPAFMAIGDYFSTKSSELDYNTAILFMIYEFIFVFFILSFLPKNKNINAGKWNESTEKSENNENIKFKVNKNMKLIILFLIIICTLFCVRYPQILNSFKFGVLSNSELIQWQKKYNFSLNSMPKLIFYMISWCIKIIKEVIIFIILLAMLILFTTFYLLTVLIKQEKISFSDTDTKTEINYDKILLGNMLDYDNEYYVLAVTDDYNNYLEFMKTNEGLAFTSLFKKNCYIAELSSGFNSKFVSKDSNLLVSNIKDLKVSTTTLFHIKNKKIVNAYEGNDEIFTYLHSVTK